MVAPSKRSYEEPREVENTPRKKFCLESPSLWKKACQTAEGVYDIDLPTLEEATLLFGFSCGLSAWRPCCSYLNWTDDKHHIITQHFLFRSRICTRYSTPTSQRFWKLGALRSTHVVHYCHFIPTNPMCHSMPCRACCTSACSPRYIPQHYLYLHV